ncbi:hypothetical protein Tco_0480188, partial [Tanacetum coccineum]
DNEIEGVDDEGEKSNKDATYVEDHGNEADRDTDDNLEGREDVFSEFKQTNQYAEALSSIPGIIDQYLA